MAKASNYCDIDYGVIADYKIHVNTIETFMGILSFPIIDEDVYRNGFTLTVYEKSFWGKKEKGYINLELIDEKGDLSKFVYDNGQTPAPDSEILIGLNFSCVYGSYYVPDLFTTYELGKPRLEILSYGMLIANIEAKSNSINQLLHGGLEDVGEDISSMAYSLDRAHHLSKQLSKLSAIKKKLEVFDKFKTVNA